jgi:hypothetical protein
MYRNRHAERRPAKKTLASGGSSNRSLHISFGNSTSKTANPPAKIVVAYERDRKDMITN